MVYFFRCRRRDINISSNASFSVRIWSSRDMRWSSAFCCSSVRMAIFVTKSVISCSRSEIVCSCFSRFTVNSVRTSLYSACLAANWVSFSFRMFLSVLFFTRSLFSQPFNLEISAFPPGIFLCTSLSRASSTIRSLSAVSCWSCNPVSSWSSLSNFVVKDLARSLKARFSSLVLISSFWCSRLLCRTFSRLVLAVFVAALTRASKFAISFMIASFCFSPRFRLPWICSKRLDNAVNSSFKPLEISVRYILCTFLCADCLTVSCSKVCSSAISTFFKLSSCCSLERSFRAAISASRDWIVSWDRIKLRSDSLCSRSVCR